jgi:diguanylate cyclase
MRTSVTGGGKFALQPAVCLGMTAYDPNLTARAIPILDWFRPRRDPMDDEPRIQQVRAIGDFLVAHDLALTPYTLTVAHDCVMDADPLLARQLSRRRESGQPVTLEWLEQTCAHGSRETGVSMLGEVMERLEQSLSQFGASAAAAQTATRDYNEALSEHGRALQKSGAASGVVTEIVNLVREMVGRTREIERDMERSEKESRQLRNNLDRAKRAADEDYLTGLPNRRAFDRRLADELNAVDETGEPLCVAFCDIDHFKRVNDTHGHETGDRVLRAVAQKLAAISNDKCHVARHGGEEFAVVLRGYTLGEAQVVVNEARESLASKQLVNRATRLPIGLVTFSAGIAEISHFPDVKDLLKAADEALYRAKQEGRNRVLVARP